MRRVLGCGVVMALLLLLASPVPSEARGHVFFRFDIPLWVGPGYWGPGSWWGPPPVYYYPAPPVILQQPPVYEPPAPQAPAYWYYCQNPPGYYPYVQQCGNGWMQVVPPTIPPRQ